jgi:tRNA(Ile)-lysidine synthase
MRNRILRTIRERELIAIGDHVLLACSGGADSVAMTRVFSAIARPRKLRLTLVHLNHGTRGEASEGDEQFVRSLAAELDLPCVVERRDVKRMARRRKVSLEMAARDARYSFFAEAAVTAGAGIVATAHTLDDQAETVLLNLGRGTGLAGLGGIPYVTDRDSVRVVRPLRDMRRADVIRYLSRNEFAWRDDASNADECHLRNRVRHTIIPAMARALNPEVVDAIARTSRVAADDDAWLTSLAEELMGACQYPAPSAGEDFDLAVAVLANLPVAARRRVLRLWLAHRGAPVEQVSLEMVDRIDALVRGRRGSGTVVLSAGWRIERSYGCLRVARTRDRDQEIAFRYRVQRSGMTLVPEASLCVETSVAEGVWREPSQGIGMLPARASLSLKALGRSALFVRSWREGDRMCPRGMRGSKKLQDVFSDAKVERSMRGCVPLLECRGEIVWLAGYCVARGWEVPDDAARALQVQVAPVV